MKRQCYICGLEANSKEHTPARCYFPDDKTYRKNLITVSSCKTHNEDTSKDDEYVRNIIAMSIGTNPIAFGQFIQKTVKSFEKSHGLLKTTTGTKKRVTINGKPSYAFQISRERFDKIMRKISYALYFYEHKKPWERELIVMTKNLFTDNLHVDELGELVQHYEKLLPINNFDGHNPQVFKYTIGETETTNLNDKILRMIFYEGFHIWVMPKEGSVEPKIE